METALEKNFSAINSCPRAGGNLQQDNMIRRDPTEGSAHSVTAQDYAVPVNTRRVPSNYVAQVLNSKKMVTLMSHVPRNERDSKPKQYLTQIKLSCKSNGQHREHAPEATRSIRVALVTGVKFCVTKICS